MTRKTLFLLCVALSTALIRGEEPPRKSGGLSEALTAYEQIARPFFVGQRDLSTSQTAVLPRPRGSVSRADLQSVRRPADKQGGIGTAYVDLTLGREVAGPLEDFRWHQQVLRPWLETRAADNQRAVDALLSLRNAMEALLREPPPEDRAAVPFALAGEGWLPAVANPLLAAHANNDAEKQSAWKSEWDAALFSQLDLHRWADFLIANQLFSLSLQAQTQPLFAQMDPLYRERLPYNANSHLGRFPGGEMTLYHADNYLELERRAEAFFHMPAAWPDLAQAQPLPPTLPPDLRADFIRLLDSLGGAHRETLASAARTPYELSYLVATLHKARVSKHLDALALVLQRYAARHPEPRLQDMMEVLHDRAGGWFCGLEWGDRFQPTLLQTPSDWPQDRLASLWRTHAWVRTHTKDTQGFVFTLREALESGAFDCIRTTDVMGALHRNAGLPGFLMLRLSRGGSGHTIAALRRENGEIHFLDGQVGNGAPGLWPRDFREPLRPHPAYAVELFGRGLDSWVFLEGYLVFGPARGNHVSAPVPYLDGYEAPRQRPLD